jgi:glycosyltransferase involved in cell wall biosynthesis
MNFPFLGKNERIDLSIVTFTRNEADIITDVLNELITELEKLKLTYEVIVTDVPSKDNTYEVLVNYAKTHKNVFPVAMNNVYGDNIQKGYQIMLGSRLARGRNIIVMDSDGQVDPKDFKAIIAKLDEGFDLVGGWRVDRKGKHGFFYNLTSKVTNLLTKTLTGVSINDKNTGLKGFSSRAAKSLTLHGRNFRDVVAQTAAKGFKITEVPVNWRTREGGIQSFKFVDRLFGGTFDFLANLFLIKANDKPMRFWGIVATIFGLLSFVFLALTIVAGVMFDKLDDDFGIPFAMIFIFAILFGVNVALSAVSLITGLLMEFIVDKKSFNVTDFVIEDEKGIVAERLS